MSSSQKKVIVRRFAGDLLFGYLPSSQFVRAGDVTLLDLEGRLVRIPLGEIKTIAYIRDFNLADAINPERIQRRAFLTRPRSEGLWLRLMFRGGNEALEGMAASDTTFLSDLAEDGGLQLTLPDTRSNTQRLFVPYSAVAQLTLLAVITSPSRRKESSRATKVAARETDALFTGELFPQRDPRRESDE